jgi:hypothetical protein
MRKALMPAFLLLLGSALLGATVLHEPLAHAAQAIFISNDASNPVPVQEQSTDENGNIKVHEQGTASVNAAQQGDWNIGIKGTPSVQVDSSASKPVWTSSSDNEAFQPFYGEVNNIDGSSGPCKSIPIPVGKRLVIDYLTVVVNSHQGGAGDAIFDVLQTNSQGELIVQSYYIPTSDQGFLLGFERFFGSEAVKIYIGPSEAVRGGTSFRLEGCFSTDDGSGGMIMTVSGHLVGLP